MAQPAPHFVTPPDDRGRTWIFPVQSDVALPVKSHALHVQLLIRRRAHNLRLMDWMPPVTLPFGERIDSLWKRGVRLMASAAISFALSTAAGICVGVVVADNAFVQILVMVLTALAFWIPMFFIVLRVDKWLAHRATDPVARLAARGGRRVCRAPHEPC